MSRSNHAHLAGRDSYPGAQFRVGIPIPLHAPPGSETRPTVGKNNFRIQTHRRACVFCVASFVLFLVFLYASIAWGQVPITDSLRSVPVPEPSNLADFVVDKAAAIRLGKAFFWDMQSGSDGIQACASCHFHAGTDGRTKNTIHPGLDGRFDTVPLPNSRVTPDMFPFHKLSNPDFREGQVDNAGNIVTAIFDFDDILGSQGVVKKQFAGILPGTSLETSGPDTDRVFVRNSRNTRRMTGRNTPTVINAVFNYTNFGDGRANHFFNGVNPFGIQDPGARVTANQGGVLVRENLVPVNPVTGLPEPRLNNASLASQAVGPLLSDVEHIWTGRIIPDLGKKMLTLRPLAKQRVHPGDSVLGELSNARITPGAPGLSTTYTDMIRAAFASRYWENETETVTFDGRGRIREYLPRPSGVLPPEMYTQMEANFPLFWGLSVQLYQATLVSDQSPFDRFLEGDPHALTPRQQLGLNVFQSNLALCNACHVGPELTAASITEVTSPFEVGFIEVMPTADTLLSNYDIGFYNVGLRPPGEDPGRAGRDPFGNPLSFSEQTLILSGLLPGADPLTFTPPADQVQGCIPVPDSGVTPPTICPPELSTVTRLATENAFKVPSLRNVELTGPYFHTGSVLTLKQAVHFYVRGGDFREANLSNMSPFIQELPALKGEQGETLLDAVVDYLLSLTDERVRQEMAPFDHPQLFLANGHTDGFEGNPKLRKHAITSDDLIELPAVGAAGRLAEGLPPLKPFLARDLEGEALANFHFQQ